MANGETRERERELGREGERKIGREGHREKLGLSSIF
jgi:hypothetical protein